MLRVLVIAHCETNNAPKEWLFGSLLAMTMGGTTALIFSLIAGLSWQKCFMVMTVVAALTGGALLTILELHRLGEGTKRGERE
jgi:hypothetical protein